MLFGKVTGRDAGKGENSQLRSSRQEFWTDWRARSLPIDDGRYLYIFCTLRPTAIPKKRCRRRPVVHTASVTAVPSSGGLLHWSVGRRGRTNILYFIRSKGIYTLYGILQARHHVRHRPVGRTDRPTSNRAGVPRLKALRTRLYIGKRKCRLPARKALPLRVNVAAAAVAEWPLRYRQRRRWWAPTVGSSTGIAVRTRIIYSSATHTQTTASLRFADPATSLVRIVDPNPGGITLVSVLKGVFQTTCPSRSTAWKTSSWPLIFYSARQFLPYIVLDRTTSTRTVSSTEYSPLSYSCCNIYLYIYIARNTLDRFTVSRSHTSIRVHVYSSDRFRFTV